MTFRSQLLRDPNTGDVIMRVDFDGHVADHTLPFAFAKMSEDEQVAYIQRVVPEMIRELIQSKNALRRKIAREAQ